MKHSTLALLIAANVSATVANAQQNNKPGLEEVVVTAERREASLQNTPISIASMSEADIQATGALALDQLADFIPGLSITANGAYGKGNPNFNIRGVGSGTSTAGVVTERPVGLYIDGLYYSRAQGSLLSMLDTERVDVLKGPQGTLFGRNTTGGAISYFSKMPTQEFESYVKARVGEFDQKELQVMVNAPLGDTTAIRFSAGTREQDGYVMRGPIDLGNTDDSVYRVQLRSELSDSVSLDLQASHSTTKSNGDTRDIVSFELADSPFPRNYFRALDITLQNQGQAPLVENDPRIILDEFSVAYYCNMDDLNPLTFGEDCNTELEGSMDVYSGTLQWAINDNWSLKSITGFLSGDQENTSDWTWTGGYDRPFEHEFNNFSQEIQLGYESDRLKFVAGAVYFNEDAEESEITREVFISNAVIGPDNTIDDITDRTRRSEEYHSEVVSMGAFAQATYSVTDRLDLTAGLRYSVDDKEVTIERFNTEFETSAARSGNGSEKWNDTDWRLAAAYNVNEDIMIYASATDAYKAGIADDSAMERSTNVDNIIPFIPPEKAIGYEIGLRSEWFDNRFRLNLSAYRTEYSNRQSTRIITIVENGENRAIIESVNLGDVNFEGYEADFALAITQNLTLKGGVAVADYTQVDAPENVLEAVPELSYTIGLNHGFELSNGASIDSSLKYGYTDETYSDQGSTEVDRQSINPDYGLLSGRIQYNSGGNWSLALFGTNLTDETYSTNAASQTFHIGGAAAAAETLVVKSEYRGRPRSMGMEFQYNF